uniref:Uncharacterized protein n=1 Tax=Bionectria ochroleuca TaxID=29856 RepID=A0A8H7TVG0_BIOOC
MAFLVRMHDQNNEKQGETGQPSPVQFDPAQSSPVRLSSASLSQNQTNRSRLWSPQSHREPARGARRASGQRQDPQRGFLATSAKDTGARALFDAMNAQYTIDAAMPSADPTPDSL